MRSRPRPAQPTVPRRIYLTPALNERLDRAMEKAGERYFNQLLVRLVQAWVEAQEKEEGE